MGLLFHDSDRSVVVQEPVGLWLMIRVTVCETEVVWVLRRIVFSYCVRACVCDWLRVFMTGLLYCCCFSFLCCRFWMEIQLLAEFLFVKFGPPRLLCV